MVGEREIMVEVLEIIVSKQFRQKTRGILIIINNCGVIVGYRELYGSESLTQVANLYLDLVDSIQSLIYFF
jgi:hypothetical protein